MASTITNLYNINGVLSTDKTVLQNLETLCTAVNAWLTYDTVRGQWAFVLNEAGTSVKSFDDSNIIGGVSITGTGLNDLYNSVRVEFPHIDLKDELDYVQIDIPDVDRNANEMDNTLVIQLDCINNPVQAEIIGLRQLKQSRVDKVIKFVTDYNAIGYKAGDIIDITLSMFSWTNKYFRIVSVVESDADDGNIYVEITALEYDADVYVNDITRYVRSTPNGIMAQGAIGIPGMPFVNKFELSTRPRVEITYQVPEGIVETMEVWYSTDVPPDVTLDENRTYNLLTTTTPDTGSNVFAFGDTLVTTSTGLGASNFLVKVRGVNSTTVGPFSIPSGVVYYAPQQVADAVTENTQLVNSGTGGLLTALTLATLLNKVDGLFGNVSGAGSLFDKVFSVFKDKTGTDLVKTGQAGTPTSTLIAGTNTYTGISSPQVQYSIDVLPVAPVVTGLYKIDVLFDTNSAGCNGGRGSYFSEHLDEISYRARLEYNGALVNYGVSGGRGTFFWSDFLITFTANLTANLVYDLEFFTTYTAGWQPATNLSVDIGYNVTRIG